MYFIISLLTTLLWICEINAQTQICNCTDFNNCYQSLNTSTDGTGQIDIRIVNGGGSVTLPPGTTATPPVTTCPTGRVLCCTPNSGCGVRYNIPPTPTTTPAAGQGRYGAQPWVAMILDLSNNSIGVGALIKPQYILTAAHKVFNRTAATMKVRLGEWNAKLDVETYKPQEYMVSSMTYNVDFKPNNLVNDVAILKLASPVQIGPNPAINMACLPDATTNYDGTRCIVSGWGRDAFTGTFQDIIKEVDVPITTTADCQTKLRATKLGPNFNLNAASFICAGGESGKDACVGDGGSPLMCPRAGKYYVVGLVAWGIGCASANVPGVYVRVQNFLSWINSNSP